MVRQFFSALLLSYLIVTSVFAQEKSVTLSGVVRTGNEALPFVNVVLRKSDSTFVSGTITNESGLFTIDNIKPGDYVFEASFIGYKRFKSPLFVGSNSSFLDLGAIRLEEDAQQLDEIVIEGQQDAVSAAMDKKTYSLSDNTTQLGGSVLQSMQNLPGVTVQDGQVQLRGNNRVMILIDGKQTAVTGFGNQNAIENIPSSAVDKIEIINNPSARFDANGNAGIINIVLKKETDDGVNGTVGLSTGWGALWVRRENLPGIRPQYDVTPKVNPSISLNYRKKKTNLFLQADNLYTETLNKNEFVTRTYNDGTVINQQLKRNRDTNFFTSKGGFDWFANDKNSLTVFGFFSKESIKDRGDQPFFNEDLSIRNRLWQFLEDEVLTAIMSSAAFHHKFTQPGHELTVGFNYTFDREDEKYFFVNTLPTYTSNESFALIADQKVVDVNVDYIRPLKHGVFETGLKFRRRTIPTNMQFFPGFNSPLDPGAAGMATYKEAIPAVYGNYRYEVKKFEAEVGLRVEYVHLQYDVDPNHNTYSSDGYDYFQPFPNLRFTFNLDDRNKLSAFFNRRVDRPDEVDIRIFPKYDDAEIIKVGNPGLSPQFTNTIELGYKNERDNGYYYGAVYRKMSDGTITRIATTDGTSNLIYNVSQNAGKSYNTGVEVVIAGQLSNRVSANLNLNGYYNQIDRFSVMNQYPVSILFTAEKQDIFSGSVKLNTKFDFTSTFNMQLTTIYLAPDIIPQGKIKDRFTVDLGLRQSIKKGRGELFANATDLFNTMIIRKSINGSTFSYTSGDYYETQVIRLGYQYKF
ncbi:MAG TPA: TonB-dependent receptor [Cyclobacteriaceae bacterium]|nr:TonB-dependent receptor [Cyclobacteriaceae bacterium]